MLGFLLLTVVPLGYAFAMSLTNFDGSSSLWRWVGLSNYRELLHDSDVWASLARTLFYTAIVVPLSVAISLGLAVLLNRRVRAVGLFRTIFFLPSVVPVVAMAIMWKRPNHHSRTTQHRLPRCRRCGCLTSSFQGRE